MVFILLGDGFEEIEALCPCDILRRAGVEVRLVGIGSLEIKGGHGITVLADMEIGSVSCVKGDLLIIPGGLGGVASIEASSEALELIRTAQSAGAFIGAICAGPRVLGKLGLLDGKKITCYPGMENEMTGACVDSGLSVVVDGLLITGRAAGSAVDFGLKLLAFIKDGNAADKIKESIYYG